MKSLSKFLPALLIVLASCGNTQQGIQQEVQTYLDDYNKKNRELYTASSEGQWKVNTHIVAGDTVNAYESRIADEAMANFTGSKENIEKARKYLEHEKDLTALQVKQLKKILYLAAGNPESASETVKELIRAGTAQTENLYGY
ncbi:MAG: peptidase, partial [Bacteroidia bacterium]|nr:peptidase [Bacteroidia bacterium]